MSMNWADLYGLPSDLSVTVSPTSVAGPNQGSVVPATGKAPGAVSSGGPSQTVAFSWLGLVLLLIAWRVIAGMAK
jgi:hypothetical protein